jgi:hypothetical protein
VLKAVRPLQVGGVPNGKTPYFGQMSSEFKRSVGSTARAVLRASNKRQADHKVDLNLT